MYKSTDDFVFLRHNPQKKKQKRAKKKKILMSLRQKKTDRDRAALSSKKNKQTNVFFCRCFFSADGSRSDDENYNRFTFKRTRRRR